MRSNRTLVACVLVPLPVLATCGACYLVGFDPTRELVVGLSLMTVGVTSFLLAATVAGKA